jgi:hypothetical protein
LIALNVSLSKADANMSSYIVASGRLPSFNISQIF